MPGTCALLGLTAVALSLSLSLTVARGDTEPAKVIFQDTTIAGKQINDMISSDDGSESTAKVLCEHVFITGLCERVSGGFVYAAATVQLTVTCIT